MRDGVSTCSVASIKDAYGGTGLCACDACAGEVLSVPLHNCLTVLDKYKAPHEQRAIAAVQHDNVLNDFESLWGLQLPEPMRAYIGDRMVSKEIRLAAFLAWMQWHAHTAHEASWWSDWLVALPKLSDVQLLRSASSSHITWLSQVCPALASRARADLSESRRKWQLTRNAAQHIWLHMRFLKPGTTAPWSYPVGTPYFRDATLLHLKFSQSAAEMYCDEIEDNTRDRCTSSDVGPLNEHSQGRNDSTEAEAIFEWAYMIVSSRSFSLSDRDGNRFACLVPLADFANHSTEPNSSFLLSSTTCTQHARPCASHVVRTQRPMKRGEEILLNYGSDKCNILLLSHYGFCTEGNLADRLALGQCGTWGDHNDIHKDLKFLDSVMQRALIRLEPSFAGMFSTDSEKALMHVLHQQPHMRRLLASAISVGEGLCWASNSPTCIPGLAEDADAETMQRAAIKHRLQAVTKRLDTISGQNCAQARTCDAPQPPVPEQLRCAVAEHKRLVECCRQIIEVVI